MIANGEIHDECPEEEMSEDALLRKQIEDNTNEVITCCMLSVLLCLSLWVGVRVLYFLH